MQTLYQEHTMEKMYVIITNKESNFRNSLVEVVRVAQGSITHGLNLKMK